MDGLVCPACGEREELSGVPVDADNPEAGVRITCGSCPTSWTRTPGHRCERCGSDQIYPAPVAIVEKSRGSQLSILGTTTTPLCWVCDRDLIDAQRQSGTALMPDELPTRSADDD